MGRVLPILFNTDMVWAILDGRKTVTRRLIKKSHCMLLSKKEPSELQKDDLYAPFDGMTDAEYIKSTYKPPYNPGDIMYVRETFGWEPCYDCGMDTEEHSCCDESAHRIFNHNKGEYGCYMYKASCGDNVYPSEGVWHPSIHMQKEAARIWLRVTDARVERLRDMKDAYREGIHFCDCPTGYTWKPDTDMHSCYTEPMAAMKALWDSTVKKTERDKYGWDANPWVWVIEFERCSKPENDETTSD